MEIAAGLIKLKPNSQSSVSNWKHTINDRRDEAIATLQDEGVRVESWFEINIGGDDYLLWYMRAESIENVWRVAAESNHDIDAYHFKVMTEIMVADGEIPATPVMDLYNPGLTE